MRNALSTLTALLVLVIGIPLLATWSVRTTILERAPWQDALQQTRVYDRVYDELLPELIRNAQTKNVTASGIPLSVDDIATIVRSAVPAAFVQEQVEGALGLVFDLVQNRTTLDAATFVIPLQDVKRRLPIAIQDRIVEKLEALPTCTDQTKKEYEKRKSLEGVLPPCLPKGTNARALVAAALPVEKIVADIPNTLDLIEKLQATSSAPGKAPLDTIRNVQEKLRKVFSAHLALTALWILLALSVGAWQLPNVRRALQWLGVTLCIVGLCTFALGWWAKAAPHKLLESKLTTPAGQIAEPALEVVAVRVTNRAQLLGAIVAATGIVSFSFGYAVRRKRVDGPRHAV